MRPIPALAAGLFVVGANACSAQVPDGGPSAPVRATSACRVTRVVDGDTLDCAPIGRIRLIGMDTPETDQAPFGEESARRLAELLPVGGDVGFEPDVEPRDQYDRALGYIWTEAGLVNWIMVRTGYAVVLTYPPNVQYVEQLEAAQRTAREDRVGLWAVDGFACEPRDHRAGRCE
jgi:micrococcal nuclease